MKKRVLWVVAYVAAMAVFVGGVVVLVRHQRDDGGGGAAALTAEDLPELASMPFPATLSSLVPSPEARVGTAVGLAVGGFSGSGVVAVELYDGDRPVATVVPPPGAPTAEVTFPALTPGTHPLSAQVIDGDGQVSLTPVVPVTVVPSDMTTDMPVPVEPMEGETPAAMADRFGVEADQIYATAPDAVAPAPDQLVPTVPVDAVIPPGSSVVAFVHPDQPPAPLPSSTGPGADGGGLTATVDDCEVTLSGIEGQALEGSGQGWTVLGDQPTVTLADARPGAHTFVVRDDNGAPIHRAQVAVPPECAEASGWTGTASIVDGVLHLPEGATGTVWAYLTVGETSIRIPEDENSIPAGRETPIATYLPPLSGQHLTLEVWRLQGDLGRVVASGELEVADGHDIGEVIGEPTRLTLGARVKASEPFDHRVEVGTQDGEVTFRWEASSPRATQVMWQVLVGDPGPGPADPAPYGLLAAGISTASGPAGPLGGNAGEFTFDTAEIPGRDPTGLDAALLAGARRVLSVELPVTFGMLTVRPDGTTSGDAAERRSISDLGAGTFATPRAPATPTTIDPTVRAVQLPTYGDDVIVRVIPLDATDAILPGPPSNTVAVRLPVPPGLDDTPVPFTVDSVTYDPGRLTHPDLAYCVRVDVPWNVTVPGDPARGVPPQGTPPPDGWTFETEVLSRFYPADGAYCHKPPPGGCDDVVCWFVEGAKTVLRTLVELATAVYEGVASVYNGVITGIVDLVAGGLCGPLVAVAGDSIDGTCQDVLGSVTRAAIGAVLATVGLPPSLPSVEELEAIASGELDVLAVQLMKQFGVPCDELATADPADAAALAEAAGVDGDVAAAAADPCRALAGAVLDQAKAAVTNTLNTDVAAATGFPSLAGVPGATMVPEPTGQPVPMRVDVQAHPRDSNADATGVVCPAVAVFDHYQYFLHPYDVPLVNPPPPSQNGYPFALSGSSPTAAFGAWTGGVGVNDYRPGSGEFINTTNPATVTVTSPCFSGPPRTVTAPLRPADARPPVRLI